MEEKKKKKSRGMWVLVYIPMLPMLDNPMDCWCYACNCRVTILCVSYVVEQRRNTTTQKHKNTNDGVVGFSLVKKSQRGREQKNKV